MYRHFSAQSWWEPSWPATLTKVPASGCMEHQCLHQLRMEQKDGPAELPEFLTHKL